MPLIRTIRSRGSVITVIANGEVLFLPNKPIANFNNELSQRVRFAAAGHAPSNKRPRWGHYGAPLKTTMRATTKINPVTMKARFAVGSTADHAVYVDQGTGVHGGNGPYPAKILPPWTRGGPSLYEHTWKINREGRRVSQVMISGQKGQEFFDKGLRDGLLAMNVAHVLVPGGVGDTVTDTATDLLAGFQGNTPNTAAFQDSLADWRRWRDRAWNAEQRLDSNASGYRIMGRRRPTNRKRNGRRPESRRNPEAANWVRDRNKEYKAEKREQAKQNRSDYNARKSRARAEFMAAVRKNKDYRFVDANPYFENGRWYVSVILKEGRQPVVRRSRPVE